MGVKSERRRRIGNMPITINDRWCVWLDSLDDQQLKGLNVLYGIVLYLAAIIFAVIGGVLLALLAYLMGAPEADGSITSIAKYSVPFIFLSLAYSIRRRKPLGRLSENQD